MNYWARRIRKEDSSTHAPKPDKHEPIIVIPITQSCCRLFETRVENSRHRLFKGGTLSLVDKEAATVLHSNGAPRKRQRTLPSIDHPFVRPADGGSGERNISSLGFPSPPFSDTDEHERLLWTRSNPRRGATTLERMSRCGNSDHCPGLFPR